MKPHEVVKQWKEREGHGWAGGQKGDGVKEHIHTYIYNIHTYITYTHT